MGMLCLLRLHQCQHPGCDMHFSFENVAFGGNWVKHSEDLTVLFLMKVLVARLCPTLCNSMDYSTPGSSVHGILQAGILEQTAISFSRVSSQPRGQTQVSCIAGRFFYHLSHQGSPHVNIQPPVNHLRMKGLCAC